MKRLISIILATAMLAMLISGISMAEKADTKKHTERMLMGDANIDGVLNTADATLILKRSSGMIQFTDEQIRYADANADGTLNTADAVHILRVAAGMTEPLYEENTVYDTYTVTYTSTLEAGTVTLPESESCDEESTFTIKYQAQAEGYIFGGWKASFDVSDSDGTEEPVDNEHIYNVGDSFIMPSCNVILTAVMTADTDPGTTPPVSESPQPTEPANSITVKYKDRLNELDVAEEVIPAAATVTAEQLKVPEGYNLINPEFCINGAETVTVGVYPYEMKDGQEFRIIKNINGFNNLSDNLNVNYSLETDIDFGGKLRLPIGWSDSAYNTYKESFKGIFDGNGHTINDLYLDYHGNSSGTKYSDVGLFAVNEGTVRNIVLYTNLPSGANDYYYGIFGDTNVGSVAGTNKGVISECRVYGYVGSLDYYSSNGGRVGGICGLNEGTVEKSSFEGMVDGLYWVGGLVGMHYGTLSESYFAGGINSTTPDSLLSQYQIRYVGGLCGGAQQSLIADCYMVCTSYLCAYRALGGMVGWYDGGVVKNIYIRTPQLYYCAAYDSEVNYTVGVFPNGESSLPSEQYGLYNFTEGTDTLPETYDPAVWDLNAQFLNILPDLINCRRGTSWFSVI